MRRNPREVPTWAVSDAVKVVMARAMRRFPRLDVADYTLRIQMIKAARRLVAMSPNAPETWRARSLEPAVQAMLVPGGIEALRELLRAGWQPTPDKIPPAVPQRTMNDWDWWKGGPTLLGFPADEPGWKEIDVAWIDPAFEWMLGSTAFWWLGKPYRAPPHVDVQIRHDAMTPTAVALAEISFDTQTGGVDAWDKIANRRIVLRVSPGKPGESIWRQVERVAAAIASADEFGREGNST